MITKEKQIRLRVSTELYDAISSFAAQHKMTVSELIRSQLVFTLNQGNEA